MRKTDIKGCKSLRSAGIALTILALLSSCVKKLEINGESFKYSPEFLECVASEYEYSIHAVCTKKAISDWATIAE